MESNTRELGGMRIELFLPMQEVQKKILIPRLAHGSNIVTVQSGNENLSDCDALITENRALTLGITTADCAPVCFSDGTRISIAHIGWRGLCLGLAEKMLAQFSTQNLVVYVAPFLHSFEIQKDFCYDQITQKFGERYLGQQSGKLIFNFKNALASVLPSQAVYDARDTATDNTFPSHRRGTKERFVTAISFV
ncbi:laccase domain-containing protein [Candidatus Kaiserbacteria bacterium]|nr:laccase domain-containing protein [Candidatus Kaiserbacteria bacterium]